MTGARASITGGDDIAAAPAQPTSPPRPQRPSAPRRAVDVFALKYGTLPLMMAVEAFHHFGSSAERSVLVVMDQLGASPCLDDAPFGSIEVVSGGARGPRRLRGQVRQRRYRRVVRDAIAGRPVRNLYLGLYSMETRVLANAIGANRVIVLDEGTSTVYRSRDRVRELADGITYMGPKGARAFRALAHLDARHLERLSFFTVFEPELTPGDEHVRSELGFYRTRLGNAPADPSLLWILGTSLVATGHIDPQLYERLVGAVVRRASEYAGRPLLAVYHPHPREDPQLTRSLCDRVGLELSTRGSSVEMRLLSTDALPGAGLWAFPSSALVTISVLLGGAAPCTMISVKELATWEPLAAVEDIVRVQARGSVEVIEASAL